MSFSIFPFDIFREIVQYILYASQRSLRRTCKQISQLPYTLENMVEERSMDEIASTIFLEAHTDLRAKHNCYVFVNGNSVRYVHSDTNSHQVYHVKRSRRWEFKSLMHLKHYLRYHTLDYFVYSDTMDELNLCFRILSNRLERHQVNFPINEIFVPTLKLLLAKLLEQEEIDFGGYCLSILQRCSCREDIQNFIQCGTWADLNTKHLQ